MKAQASLRTGTVSPVPTRYVYSKCGTICKSDENVMVSLSDSSVLEEDTSESLDEPALAQAHQGLHFCA